MTGNQTALADFLGIHKASVSRAVKAGRLVAEPDGSFDFDKNAALWHRTAGGRADLVVLGADPLWQGQTPVETAAHLRAMPVLATVCAGRVTFAGDSPGVP